MASRLRASDDSSPASFSRSCLHALPLRVDLRLGLLRRVQQRRRQFLAHRRREPRQQRLRKLLLLVERGPHAETKLGIVFKQRVGPRRPASLRILAVRRGGQVAAINRRAAGRVGDIQPVAEQLRQQLDVSRLAATGACAGELKQRLQQLQVLHLAMRQLAAIHFRQAQEEVPVSRSGSRSGACGAMLMALWLASLLLFTGQTSTQTAQPVQSSGATCSV